MTLTTMKSVAAALEKKIKADASGEETGGEAEKVLDTGEMPVVTEPKADDASGTVDTGGEAGTDGEDEKSPDQWTEVSKNPEEWELTDGSGRTYPIDSAVKTDSGRKTYKIVLPGGGISKPLKLDSLTVISKKKAAPETKEEPTIDSTPAPAAAAKELTFKELKDIRDQIKNTNSADIKDIVQKIGAQNIKFILRSVAGPNASIVTTLNRGENPVVLEISLVDERGLQKTDNQSFLDDNSNEESIKARVNDKKRGLKLFMPDQFEELFSQITPSKGKPEAGSGIKPSAPPAAKPEAEKVPAVDTKAKSPAPAVPPKAPASSEDRWKPLSDKLTEKGIPEDVAKKVLEFFGAQTKKVKLVEDDILSEVRPRGSGLQTVKFTDWLKEQGFDEEITRKIIEAVAEIAAQGTEQQLFAGSGGVGKTLTKNMGYAAKPKELSGQARSSEGPKPAVDTGVGSDDQDDEVDDEDGGSNKKRVDQWAEVKKNPAGWELTTVRGITVKIADAITLPSGKKTYTVIKADGGVSGPLNPDLIALVGKVKSSTKTPAAEVPAAKPEIPPVKPEEKPETELSQESKKLYRSLDAVSGETLGRILSLNGEYKTIHGGASDLMAIYKFASPELQDKIKKNVKGASEILTQIPAIKQKYDSITVEQAGTILSNAFTEFDNQNARENQAKIDKSKESSVAAPAPEPQKTTAPEEQTDEQKALKHIKQNILKAKNKTAIRIDSLYEKGLVTPSNVIDLLNKAKKDPEIEKYIASAGSKPLEQIIFKKASATKARPESEAPSKGELDISKLKLGGETDEEEPPEDEDGEGPPEEEVDGEPEQEVPLVPKNVGKKGSKEPKQTAPVEDLKGIKKKATSILKKYAKKEGKEGEDLNTFIGNIKKAENKVAIIQIFDNALEQDNAFKASEELNGDSSKKAEAPPTAPEIDATEAQPEPEMTPEKLKYGKKQVQKILGDRGVKISSDIKDALEAAEDERGLRSVLFDAFEDATEAKMELTRTLEDYDSKQVQKESITRPMFVLKEGIFRLNRY